MALYNTVLDTTQTNDVTQMVIDNLFCLYLKIEITILRFIQSAEKH